MRRWFLLLAISALAAPALAAQPAAQAGQRFVVFFQEWSAGLDHPALATIAAAAHVAERVPTAAVVVTGYADPLGSVQANIYLTETRAQVVTDQLVTDGIQRSRIQQHAKGKVPYQLTSQESRRVLISIGGK
ncbi:MAG: OmpA family protein [Acetobacteraceae bacterium]